MGVQDPYASEQHSKRIKVVLPLTLAVVLVAAVLGILVPPLRLITQIAIPLAGATGGAIIGWHAIQR